MSNSVIAATMQITHTGGLDEYLTGHPEVSLFDYDYKRITPFAKHSIMVSFNEKVDFGRTITATIPFMGDLVHTVYLYFRLPQLTPPPGSTYLGWTNTVAYAMIESVQIRINDSIIDQTNGLFMEIMDYLNTPMDKQRAKNKIIGRYDTVNVLPINALGEQDIYVPLQFWFNKKRFSSLPLVTLSGQSVKIHVKLRPFDQVVTYDGSTKPVPHPIQNSSVLIDYYMLSNAERLSFKNELQSYLIEQWQWQTFEIPVGITTSRFTLDFTRCIKELVFVLVETESETNNDYFNFGKRTGSIGGELVSNVGLAFDGRTRLEKMPESFYRIVTTSKYHTFGGNRNIYTISFAENPETNQPTGTANFSRYDSVELLLDFVDDLPQCRLHILAVTYNKFNIATDGIQIEFLN
jgi:hypothetical protein